MTARQLELAFDDTPRWDASSLGAVLARYAERPLRLVVTDNRSVLLSFKREASALELRLHRMFLHAPDSVVVSLARNIRRRGRAAGGEVRRFMNANMHRVRGSPRVMPPLVATGRVYDLAALYADINDRFFGGRLMVPFTWCRGVGRARRGGHA